MRLLAKLRRVLAKVLSRKKKPAAPIETISNEEDNPPEKLVYPAESELHEATILGFPSRCSLPPTHYDAVCAELIDLALAIAEFEPVRMYVRPDEKQLAESLIKATHKESSKVTLIPCPINHCWVRDTGPVYVREATPTIPNRRFALNFRFNEWGGKRPQSDGNRWGQQWPPMDEEALRENADFARWVIEHDKQPLPVTCIDAAIRVEGGALVTDGDGTLLITESSIIGATRNPPAKGSTEKYTYNRLLDSCNVPGRGMSKAVIEAELKRLLGVEKVIWFPGRVGADITDVHMDAEARFVRPGVIVYSKPHDEASDLWKEISAEILEILERETDARGRRFEIHTIEEPDPRQLVQKEEDELAASYVNFCFVNGGLIIPRFGDNEKDGKALEMLQTLFPERVVRQVYTNAIPLTGGVIHCVTQQVPAMTPKSGLCFH